MERARSRCKQRGEIEVEGKNEKKNKEKKGGKRCDGLKRRGRAI